MKNNTLRYLLIALLFSVNCGFAQIMTITSYTTANGLPDNNVLDVAVDGNNTKWFATQGGVCRYNDTSWTTFTTANGLIDNFINCIAADHYNNIWVGTDFGISKWNGSTWTSYTAANGLVSNTISDIAVDIDNSIWIGTSAGLSHFNGTTFTNFTTANGLANNLVSCIVVDAAGNKWIGTYIGGLSKYNGSTFTTFTTSTNLPDNNITALAVDGLGNKWVGTYYGTAVFNSSDTWVVTYTHSDGLYHNYVQDIVADANNTMWFGIFADYLLDGAVTRFTGTTWTSFSTPEGIADKMVNQLAVETGSIIWVATGNGASKMAVSSGIQDPEKQEAFMVFPNPARDMFQIPPHSQDVQLKIFDMTGQLKHITTLEAGNNTVEVTSLKPGVYSLQLIENNNTATTKLITL